MQSIADSIVSWCPGIFMSSPNSVEETPDGWFANFVSNDTTLIFKSDRILLSQPHTSGDLDLGTLHDWERGVRPNCLAIPARLRNVLTFD